MAQHAAEQERDYQSAWQAGSRYAEAGDEIKEARKAALAILKERRAVKGMSAYPALCNAIRASVRGLISDIAERRQLRAKLSEGDGGKYLSFWPGDKRLQAAFNEGAGESVFA